MRKIVLVIVATVLALILVCTGVVAYLSSLPFSPGPSRLTFNEVKDLEFIDGGSGNDTIKATAVNWSDKTITVTEAYVAQRAWVQDGRIQNSDHPFTTGLSGDLTIPSNATKKIRLILPKDTLVPGKEYIVSLTGAFENNTKASFFSRVERYVFYHMYHPNAPGPVEEGVITDLGISIIHLNLHDSILALVQNTGDTPITIEGGFVNGMAALDAVDGPILLDKTAIAPNSTGSVDLRFKADSYMLQQYENWTSFNVKLITSNGNIIEYPDEFFVHWGQVGVTWKKLPIINDERAEISNVKFGNSGDVNSISMSVHNSGSNMIKITGAMLNGKGVTVDLLNYTIATGITRTITLPFYYELPDQGSAYRLVLISSQNNAFIYNSNMT